MSNNSYIYYSNIWKATAVSCVTDNENCCSNSLIIGGWHNERGRPVQQGSDGADSLYTTRGHGVIHLNRNNDCIPPTSGLWRRCAIPDSAGVNQSLYIYIVNDKTAGNLCVVCVLFS